MTLEIGQDMKLTEGQRRSSQTPLRARESSQDREIEKWRERERGRGEERRGEVFTLNDWDRPGRERGGKGQTEMLWGGETNGKR